MGTTFRFIAAPSDQSEVLAWFRALPEPPEFVVTAKGTVMYFRSAGSLVYAADGSIDSKQSPVATVFLPRVVRGALWTVGEVHFLTTPMRQLFPSLHKISSAFSRWLGAHECVFSNKSNTNLYKYYLEGSIRNYDPPVFAFGSGLDALKAERYFVDDKDTDFVIDKLCKTLRLRGIECSQT